MTLRHQLGLLYTDGVHETVARRIIDAIAWHWKTQRMLRAQSFLVVRLTVTRDATGQDPTAILTFHADWLDNRPEAYPPLFTQAIESTDFALDSIQLFLSRDTLMLPAEVLQFG